MDQENTLHSSQAPLQAPLTEKHLTPSTTPEQPAQTKLNKKRWIFSSLVVLFIGIGIGIFLSNGSKKENTPVSQLVTQESIPQTHTSFAPVSSGNISVYPTVSLSALPLGDNKYTTTGPKKGYVYVCNVMKGGGGAQSSGSWLGTTTWTPQGKPKVLGSVTWPNAMFSDTVSGSTRTLSGNGLPVGMITGTFPVASTYPAYQYDRNPNSIRTQSLHLTLPVNPNVSITPNCMGGEVGVMSNGVPLFNAFDEEMRDAAAHEIQDSCDGHPQEGGEYHYHSLSSCFKDIKESTVLGFALDGFPITGPVQVNGTYLTTAALDECHGTTSTIILDGKQVRMYHYVMTEDFPYSVSCFRGKPVSLQVIQGVKGGAQSGSNEQMPSGQGNGMPPRQGQNNQLPPRGPQGQIPPNQTPGGTQTQY